MLQNTTCGVLGDYLLWRGLPGDRDSGEAQPTTKGCKTKDFQIRWEVINHYLFMTPVQNLESGELQAKTTILNRSAGNNYFDEKIISRRKYY